MMDSDSALGFVAALCAPFAMTIGFVIWGHSWKSSPYALNLFKCTFASIMFMIISFSYRTSTQATFHQQSLIMFSSFIGIVIGDNTWLLALKLIGAKKVIIIDALKPFCAAVLGHFFLGEAVDAFIVLGMAVTSVGVVMASLDHTDANTGESTTNRNNESTPEETSGDIRHYRTIESGDDERDGKTDGSGKTSAAINNNHTALVSLPTVLQWEGYGLAAMNVILDAVGSVLVKVNGTALTTWEINFLRFGFAAVVMAAFSGIANIAVALGSAASSSTPVTAAASVATKSSPSGTITRTYGENMPKNMSLYSLLILFGFVSNNQDARFDRINNSSMRDICDQDDSGGLAYMHSPSASTAAVPSPKNSRHGFARGSFFGSDILDDCSSQVDNPLSTDYGYANKPLDATGSTIETSSMEIERGVANTDSGIDNATRQPAQCGVAGDVGGGGDGTHDAMQFVIEDGVSNSLPDTDDQWYIFPAHSRMTPTQWGSVVLGILFVTFLCPALSTYALFRIPLSLALTLNSLGPINSVPVAYIVSREASGMKSILGAVLAVAGVCIFMLK